MEWFILAFISALFSAASAVSEKKALFSLDALNFSFIVSTATLVFSLPFFLSVNISTVSSSGLIILFIKTILSAGAFMCVMLSMKNMEISEALPLLGLSPALVAIGGVILVNDILSGTEWLGIALMAAGAYVLELKKGIKNPLEPFKALFSFSKYAYVFYALLLFTATSLIDRFLLKGDKFPPYTFMAFQQLFYAVVFALVILAKKRNAFKMVKELNRNTIYLIIAVALFTVIYRYTQIEATKMAPVALVLSIKRLSVLFAVVYGGRMFSEENLYRRIAAVVIILIGTALLLSH
jgi:drug/metabolite transporter (DMT)-like permease